MLNKDKENLTFVRFLIYFYFKYDIININSKKGDNMQVNVSKATQRNWKKLNVSDDNEKLVS